MTTIVVRPKKSDFLRLGLHAALSNPKLKWALFMVAAVVFTIDIRHARAPWEPLYLIVTFLTIALFVFGYFLLMVALTMLSAVLRNRRGTPAAEIQTYTITDSGLSRSSPSSEYLMKWGGAWALHRNKNAIYVSISPLSYLILPRRSFASDEEYASVWTELQKLSRHRRPGGL